MSQQPDGPEASTLLEFAYVIETNDYKRVNQYLALGWRFFATHRAPPDRGQEAAEVTHYCLGWPASLGKPKVISFHWGNEHVLEVEPEENLHDLVRHDLGETYDTHVQRRTIPPTADPVFVDEHLLDNE